MIRYSASKLETLNPRLFQSGNLRLKDTPRVTLKLVNASSTPQSVDIKLNGAIHVNSKLTVTTLSGKTTQETNSIREPTKIVPVVSSIMNGGTTFTHSLPKYSIQVLDIELN